MRNVERGIVWGVFGDGNQRVAGTLTGRRMSTPDTGKPELVEVHLDSTVEPVWVPENFVEPLGFEVRLTVEQESFHSPTEAALAVVDWLRSESAGGVVFQVFCEDDRITYSIEALLDAETGEWSAYVKNAWQEVSGEKKKPRPDLISTQDDA